jgi:DNA-binding MarR family transcriptional regulator
MSNPTPPADSVAELRVRVAGEMEAYQASVDAFDEIAAQRLGVSRTDLRCIEILVKEHRTSPGVLGPALGLTSGGVTAMLTRLERQGYLRRFSHPWDGRRVIVEVTEQALSRAGDLYGPVAGEGADLIREFRPEDLRLLADFLHDCRELYERHLARVRSAPNASS